jgi:hypothetical protein
MQDAVHLDDNVLELYALNRLSVADAESVEDHVALCKGCLDRLDEEVAFVRNLKAVLERDQANERNDGKIDTRRWNWLAGWKSRVWTFAAVAMAVLLFFVWRPPANGNLVAVALTATRGPSTVVHEEGPFDFEIFVPESAESYRAVLIDAEGSTMWSGDAETKDGKPHAIVRRKLKPGQYFLRVSDPSSHSTHEYGLTIAP